MHIFDIESSTTQGGGVIGEVSCCDAWMTGRAQRWVKGWLELCCAEWRNVVELLLWCVISIAQLQLLLWWCQQCRVLLSRVV